MKLTILLVLISLGLEGNVIIVNTFLITQVKLLTGGAIKCYTCPHPNHPYCHFGIGKDYGEVTQCKWDEPFCSVIRKGKFLAFHKFFLNKYLFFSVDEDNKSTFFRGCIRDPYGPTNYSDCYDVIREPSFHCYCSWMLCNSTENRDIDAITMIIMVFATAFLLCL